MSTIPVDRRDTPPLALPPDLEQRLHAFRRLVWRIKLAEAFCGAACGVLVGYLLLFAVDRLTETPIWFRWVTFVVAVASCTAVPWALHRWVWRYRGLDQIARLVGRRFPTLGDHLLGIIEIVRRDAAGEDPGEMGGSRRLCEAAIGQVADQSQRYEFATAVPQPRHRRWALLAILPAAAAIAAAVFLTPAALNAWARLLQPWRSIERYAFTRLDPLPERIVVPRGEPAPLEVALSSATLQQPAVGQVRIGGQKPLVSALLNNRYAFTVPPQLEEAPLDVAIGDARHTTRIVPMPRPAITSITAEVGFPDYLQRPGTTTDAVRGGSLAPVKGSTVTVVLEADRPLESATLDGAALAPVGTQVRTPARMITEDTQLTFGWRDAHGLDAIRPLTLSIVPRDDDAPTFSLHDAPRSRDMLLATDTLRFRIDVRDDFGIARVGLEWESATEAGKAAASTTKGDRLLQAGGPEEQALDVAATFCPAALGIAPQPIVLRAFAEDYLPGRGRVYGPPIMIYVLDPAEHALVVNERLSRWRQQTVEVRDRELTLLATNKELRALPVDKLQEATTRSKIEQQASAEQAQARRMSRLVSDGESLVHEAMKNPEFEAELLDELAEDVQTLAEIAGKRMPSVADLLKAAARARESSPSSKPGSASTAAAGKQPPKVGENRDPGGGKPGGSPGGLPKPPVPQVVDRESSQQPKDKGNDDAAGGKKPGGPGRLGLPTTVAGVTPPKKAGDKDGPPSDEQPSDEPEADQALASAVEAQEKLLEEFAKVAEELAAVMARLEGTTFVKRLKLASRQQLTIGSQLAGLIGAEKPTKRSRDAYEPLRQTNTREAEKVSHLMDDMQAYFDRRRLPVFRTVLEEMRTLETLASLRQLSDEIPKEPGMSIAQAEFWSDTFDRLADDLVTPRKGDQCKKCKSPPNGKPSLPPEAVLEAMRILEGEMNLREETRVAEQTRKGLAADEFATRAKGLAETQSALAKRVEKVIALLVNAPLEAQPIDWNQPLFGPLKLPPDGRQMYGDEINLLDMVKGVMGEATAILASPHTGSRALAVETEVIELLLTSQSPCNCGGGGGGSSLLGGGSPGGGGTGTTRTSALALVGRGNTDKGAGDDVEERQSVGAAGRVLPDEFRAGLDAYFNKIEAATP